VSINAASLEDGPVALPALLRRTDQISEGFMDMTTHDPGAQFPSGDLPQTAQRWQSFEEFYELAYPRLLRLGVALVWSKAIAEDHVQDACQNLCALCNTRRA
jgi:hypothetical protein